MRFCDWLNPANSVHASYFCIVINISMIFLPAYSAAAEVIDFSQAAASAINAVVTVVVKNPSEAADVPFNNTIRDQSTAASHQDDLQVRENQDTEIVSNHGSGFLFRSDGYILTAAHVVSEAQSVNVLHNNERSYPAEIVLLDEALDIAVLKINDEQLPALPISRHRIATLGEAVMTVGSPYSFSNTVSSGIVSNTARVLSNGSGLGQNEIPYIQTDIPVNPGYSGGPVLNGDGDVI